MNEFRNAMYETALAAGIPILSKDTCARLLAIVHSITHEGFTYSERARAEIRYAQKRFGVDGGETPDPGFARLVKRYVDEIEGYGAANKTVVPWAAEFAKERYGIELFW